MRPAIGKAARLCVLCLISCASQVGSSDTGGTGSSNTGERGSSGSRSTTCPHGATKTTFLLFRSENHQGYRLLTAEGLVPLDSCQLGFKDDRSVDTAAFTQLLDAHRCGGDAVTSFAGWNVRFIQGMNGNPSVDGVVESPGAVYVVTHSTTGGMPGGAQDEMTFAVVFPPTAKPISSCGTVTDLGPYTGPMPP